MTLRSVITVSFLLAAAYNAAGQEGETFYLSNRAFLDTFQGRTAYTELVARKDNGGLINLSESPDSYLTGAATESYCRVSDKLSFYGKLSWTYFQGKDMGGQILMDPEYNPVNFLETSETNRGIKKKETYNLQGGLSYRLGRRWSVGAGVNYTCADQTKIKDPRFNSVWMDIDAHAGAMFRATNKVLLGAALTYRNTLELLNSGIYGTTDKQYFIQSDRGGFLGTVTELSGDTGHISVNNSRPMSNSFWGASLQFASEGVFTSEIWASSRNGYYGRKSSGTVTFFEFNGLEGGVSGNLKMGNGHLLSISAKAATLNNIENKYQYVTIPGQSTQVKYTGKDAIFQRITMNARLAYSWTGEERLAAGIALEARNRDQKTSIYPFYRTQKVASAGADLWLRYLIPAGRTNISAEAHALTGGGWGTPKDDGSSASASATTIRSFDNYLNKQFEYETAVRAGGILAVTLTLPAYGKVTPYIRIGDQFISLLKAPEYLEGASRNTATITLGCNF